MIPNPKLEKALEQLDAPTSKQDRQLTEIIRQLQLNTYMGYLICKVNCAVGTPSSDAELLQRAEEILRQSNPQLISR